MLMRERNGSVDRHARSRTDSATQSRAHHRREGRGMADGGAGSKHGWRRTSPPHAQLARRCYDTIVRGRILHEVNSTRHGVVVGVCATDTNMAAVRYGPEVTNTLVCRYRTTRNEVRKMESSRTHQHMALPGKTHI